MHTETAATINGPIEAVFAYAARVEDWPRLLPHYRGVRIVRTVRDAPASAAPAAVPAPPVPAPPVPAPPVPAAPASAAADDAGTVDRIVEMKARRGRIPVWWWARQVVLPHLRRIRYTHVRGVTRGMQVEWRLEEGRAGEVRVTIVHDLKLRWPVIGRPVARWIIGPLFVEPTARATLARIKRLVEGA